MKSKRIVNQKLLERVSREPCLACSAKPSDPHHVTTRGAGGDDTPENVMPLCRRHHTAWHKSGPAYMIFKFYRIQEWLAQHDRLDVIERATGK